MTSLHSGSFAEHQLPLLTDLSRRRLDRLSPSDCPFCDSWNEDLANQNTQITENNDLVVTPEQFRSHVGRHMLQLALFAITPGVDDGDTGESACAMPSKPEDDAMAGSVTSQNTFEFIQGGPIEDPLVFAAADGLDSEVSELLGNEACLEHASKALYQAASNGHASVIERLLQCKGINVNFREPKSQTAPLIAASMMGYEAVVRLLLQNSDVDINWRDRRGATSLSEAASNGYEEIVKLLLQTGMADVDSRDQNGWTPLSEAARNGHEAVVKLLLQTSTDVVDCKDSLTEDTPLSSAAKNGHEAVVKLLLQTNMVDVNSADWQTRTPLSRAVENGQRT